jgi:hypothetical protein
VYDAARSNLADLQLVSESGENLPYFLHRVHDVDGFPESVRPDFAVDDQGRYSFVRLEGLRHVPLMSIDFETGSMFQRDFQLGKLQETLYNLQVGSEVSRGLNFYIGGGIFLDVLEFHIDNRDDAPLVIDSIVAHYLTGDIVFHRPEGRQVYLYFGSDRETPPQYDIQNYKELILGTGYELLSSGSLSMLEPATGENPSADDPSLDTDPAPSVPFLPFSGETIFDICITLAAVALVIVIILRLRKV